MVLCPYVKISQLKSTTLFQLVPMAHIFPVNIFYGVHQLPKQPPSFQFSQSSSSFHEIEEITAFSITHDDGNFFGVFDCFNVFNNMFIFTFGILRCKDKDQQLETNTSKEKPTLVRYCIIEFSIRAIFSHCGRRELFRTILMATSLPVFSCRAKKTSPLAPLPVVKAFV
jgi:hypothetical protein